MEKAAAQPWDEIERWWVGMAERFGVADRVTAFFKNARGIQGPLAAIERLRANIHYILFVLLRYWIPVVLPPPGRERLSKNDPDYWLESEQILRAAVRRLRELKPLIELLTASNPFEDATRRGGSASKPVVEVELATMLEGIAEVAGSYGGPDYTSVIKHFDPIPLRQIQPFKHNKKNSAELWVIFLLREHFKALGLSKDRYWPLLADLAAAADIMQPTGAAYPPDELKSWWQKNWPRTYTDLEHKAAHGQSGGTAYEQDFAWFQSWINWQLARTPPP